MKSRTRTFLQILLFVFIATTFTPAVIFAVPIVDDKVTKTLLTKPVVNVILSFHKGNATELLEKVISETKFASLNELRTVTYKLFKTNADATQTKVKNVLEEAMIITTTMPTTPTTPTITERVEKRSDSTSNSIRMSQLWITNQLIVDNVDQNLLDKLKVIEDLASIMENSYIEDDEELDYLPEQLEKSGNARQWTGDDWGIKSMGVDEAWKKGFRGKGAVVGIVSSGVRGTHESLKDNFRSPYGWFDPHLKSSLPDDPTGIGTSAAAVAVGRTSTKDIGVAHEAKWIACTRGKPGESKGNDISECLHWMTCPTDTNGNNPDCSKTPNVVVGTLARADPNETGALIPVLYHLQKLHIVTVFNIGTGGPQCSTVKNPGGFFYTLGVGTYTSSNISGRRSAAGPVESGAVKYFKPDVSAPGPGIWTASNTSDTAYRNVSLCAAAHVGGLAALVYGAYPKLLVSDFKDGLLKGALPLQPSGRNCGGIDESNYPNHVAGYGRVNALNTIKYAEEHVPRSTVVLTQSSTFSLILPFMLTFLDYSETGCC